jgi:tripartite motif-containing protein 2/3
LPSPNSFFQVLIFDRPIKDCPLFFDVSEHNPPLIVFGTRGAKEKGFMQPCGVTVDGRGHVFVVDTGNSRVKKLTANLDFVSHVTNESLEGRSVTGICMGSSLDSLVNQLLLLFF